MIFPHFFRDQKASNSFPQERCLRCCGRALRHHRPNFRFNTVLVQLAMRLAKLLTTFVRLAILIDWGGRDLGEIMRHI